MDSMAGICGSRPSQNRGRMGILRLWLGWRWAARPTHQIPVNSIRSALSSLVFGQACGHSRIQGIKMRGYLELQPLTQPYRYQ